MQEERGFGVREKNKAKKDAEKRSRGRPPLPKGLKCEKCNTTDTPEWRVGENGPHTLCNACGLQYAKKKKVEIESKAKHSIKNILNESEPAGAAVAEVVSRAQQDFQIHNATYGKTSGVPAYHANKNKRPSAIAISSPSGSPMITRANSSSSFSNPSSNNSSPMTFAPSSPYNFPSYFSAMSLSSPTSSSSPPPPFLPSTPPVPRMSPFNPASSVAPSPTPSYSSSSLPAYSIPPPVGYPPELYPQSPQNLLYLSSEVIDKTSATTSPIPINNSQELVNKTLSSYQPQLYAQSSTPPKNSPIHQYGYFSSNNPPYIPQKNMMMTQAYNNDMDIHTPPHPHSNIPRNYNEENMDYM